MRRASGRRPWIVGAIVIALSMVGCAAPVPAPAVSTEPTRSVAPTAVASPNAVVTPSAVAATVTPSLATPSATPDGPFRFQSVQYAYALTMPAKTLTRRWAAATRPWDGVQRFDMLGSLLDRVGVPDGSLFVIGGAAPSGLQEFVDRTVAGTNLHHDCTKPSDRRSVTIGGVKGVAFAQSCAGQLLVRVTLVREKRGLVAFVLANASAEAVALDDLIKMLDSLEWLPA